MATAAVLNDFESKLDKSGECWTWTGFRVATGYGRFYAQGKTWRAHRFAYEHFVGPIGAKHVLHKCDNPPCCNPDHLFLGTPADNANDRMQKGRSGKEKRSGEKAGLAKLNRSDVREIRASSESLATLAAKYGVSKSAVHYVRTGKTWVDA